jgi:hypothetical protein
MRFQVCRPALDWLSLKVGLNNLIAESRLAFDDDSDNRRALERFESDHFQLAEYSGRSYGVAFAP